MPCSSPPSKTPPVNRLCIPVSRELNGGWVRRVSDGFVAAGTADVIPQPNLDMLNPTLEDLLDKFEPMEGLI